MQPFSKYIGTVVLGLLLFSAAPCQIRNSFGQWTVSTTTNAGLPWINFMWANDSLGSRYFERTAMFIPVKIEGLPNTFLFQFDLGADITMLYGNPLKSIFLKHPEFDRIRRYKSSLQFWNTQTAFKDLALSFGETQATTKNCSVMWGLGDQMPARFLTDSSPVKMGTIGADLFQNKILVLDYPNQRFVVLDTLPTAFQTSFVAMSLDEGGRAIIPLQLKGKTYRVMFDNGASIFPLLVTDNKADAFSTAVSTDTLAISSWGTTHPVIGRPLKEPFQLAGQNFSDIMMYTEYRKEARNKGYDAIAGNALFWDRMVILDFKNKQIGFK